MFATPSMAQSSLIGKHGPQDIEPFRLARTRWSWFQTVLANPDLSFAAKSIAGGLLQFLNEKLAKAWPSHETLAKACGTSSRTVRRALNELAAAGLLRIDGRKGGLSKSAGHARGRTCEYRLASGEGGQICPPCEPPKVDRSAGITWTTLSEEPSKEPSKVIHLREGRDHPSPTEKNAASENSLVERETEVQPSTSTKTDTQLVEIGHESDIIEPIPDAHFAVGRVIARLIGQPPGAGRAVLHKMPEQDRRRLLGECSKRRLTVQLVVEAMRHAAPTTKEELSEASCAHRD